MLHAAQRADRSRVLIEVDEILSMLRSSRPGSRQWLGLQCRLQSLPEPPTGRRFRTLVRGRSRVRTWRRTRGQSSAGGR
jgi:hypothetical protein